MIAAIAQSRQASVAKNYQQKDGSVVVLEVLRRYLGEGLQ